MENLIFDTHAHYTKIGYAEDLRSILDEMPISGVKWVLNCSVDYESSLEALALAEQYSWMYVAVGIHPQSLIDKDASTNTEFKGDWRQELKAIEKLLDNKKVIAIGEVGLDKHWPVPKEQQLQMFEAQIKLALERDLPLSIHDREAHMEMYQLLKKYRPKGVLHSFSGAAEDVKWLCAQGIYIGFSGVLTFKNARKTAEVAALVPREYFVLETDCPYLAPEPFRGKRCHSGMIAHTAKKMAEICSTSTEEILKQSLKNGMQLFNLPVN